MATTKITTPELFDLSTVNTALRLPNGDNSTRPTSASQGEWRFNTERKYVEFYDGGEWRQIDTEVTCTTNTVDYPTTNAAYYKLDSSAADQTTNNHDGTPQEITYYNGQQYSQAAVFNGLTTSSRSKITTSGLSTYNNFSISFWMNSDDLSNSTAALVMGTSDNYLTTTGFGIFTGFPANNNITWIVSNGSSRVDITANSNLNTNQWHHIVITQNTSDNSKKIYIDGGLSGTSTSSTNVTGQGYSLLFGGYSTFTNNTYDGKLDQVRIFSSALSASQVTELYNEVQCPCTTNTVDEPTTNVAYYKLDGNANDATNTYNGTWSGTEAYAYGPYGVSAVFNGSNTSIDSNFTLPADSTMSFSFWLNQNTHTSGNNGIFSDFDSVGNNKDSRFTLAVTTSNALYINIGNGTSFFTDSSVSMASYINKWMHLCVTLNGTSIKVYINGGAPTSITSSVAFGTAGVISQIIGRLGLLTSAGRYYDGEIDQVRIFDVELSATQVTSLYDEVYCNTVSTLNIFNEGTSSCIALYELEDNANSTDSSTYNGTWSGTEAYGGGQYKKAGIFNGSTSKIVLPTLSSDFVGANSRSVSAWVRITSTPSASLCIFNSGDAATLEAFGYFIGTSRQIIISYFNKNWSTSEIISLNTWNHIVFTYNGGAVETSSNSAVYINGTLATLGSATGSATGSANTSNTNHAIGVFNATSALFFDGSIDQVRLFNKELTATEVLQVYTE